MTKNVIINEDHIFGDSASTGKRRRKKKKEQKPTGKEQYETFDASLDLHGQYFPFLWFLDWFVPDPLNKTISIESLADERVKRLYENRWTENKAKSNQYRRQYGYIMENHNVKYH